MKILLPYIRYVKPCRGKLIIAIICGFIFGISSGLGLPTVINVVFKKIFEEQTSETHNIYYILGVAMLVPAVFIIRAIFGYASAYLMCFSSLEILRQLKLDIFSKIQTYPVSFFDKYTTGDLLTRLNGDTNAIQAILVSFASEIFKQPIQAFGAFIFIAYTCISIGEFTSFLIIAAAIPFCILPVQMIRKNLKRFAGKSQIELANMSQAMTENLDAIHEVRVFNLQDAQTEKFNSFNLEHRKFTMKVTKYEQLQQPFMEVLSAIIVSIIFVYAYYSNIGFSTFLSIGIALYFMIDPIKRIIRMSSDFIKIVPLIERLNQILNYETTVPDPENPVSTPAIRGRLSFSDVSFSYNEKVVLNDVNIDIPAGTSCALVGESGAGKSTFAKLAMRLYDPASGSIKIDNIDLKAFRKTDFMAKLGSVPQYPVLFDDTVYNNIAFGKKDATKEEVLAAAKSAYAHDFIQELENGYDTIVGKRGDRLSGGQKQRIALARVFLKNPPFIVLDEATSALDVNSEAYIQRAIDSLMKDRTMLIIAHRFSTIKNVKKIIVFSEGKIVDSGSHEELISRCDHYKSLYSKQQGKD